MRGHVCCHAKLTHLDDTQRVLRTCLHNRILNRCHWAKTTVWGCSLSSEPAHNRSDISCCIPCKTSCLHADGAETALTCPQWIFVVWSWQKTNHLRLSPQIHRKKDHWGHLTLVGTHQAVMSALCMGRLAGEFSSWQLKMAKVSQLCDPATSVVFAQWHRVVSNRWKISASRGDLSQVGRWHNGIRSLGLFNTGLSRAG